MRVHPPLINDKLSNRASHVSYMQTVCQYRVITGVLEKTSLMEVIFFSIVEVYPGCNVMHCKSFV